MERKQERAKKEFLVKRSSDEVSPSYPAAEGFIEVLPCDPVPPSGVDYAAFEEWASEEEGGEEEGFEGRG